MSPDHAPLTNAALAEALAIVSRTPALHPPLYICNFDHHASVVQTLVLGPLPAPSAADTFWARERDGVYDYASGALVLRRCGPTADRGGPAGVMCSREAGARSDAPGRVRAHLGHARTALSQRLLGPSAGREPPARAGRADARRLG
jgi:hypothetical protein